MSLCVNYPFLSNYLRNQTSILSNKTKYTACRSLACTICVKWKKDGLTEKCCTFCTLEDYQTNAILWSHSTVWIGYTSISRNEEKQEHAAFQGCFGQRFGCQDKCPQVSDHTFPYNHPQPPLPTKQTSSTPRKPLPQHNFDSVMIIKLNLYQTQRHTQKQQNKILASQSVRQSNNQF